MPDQGSAFVESVLLTVLNKLYKELHSAIQNSQVLSARFPALASADLFLIAAASPSIPISTTGTQPGVTVMGPVSDPALSSLLSQESVETPAGRTSSVKPLINKALQMTGQHHECNQELRMTRVLSAYMLLGHLGPDDVVISTCNPTIKGASIHIIAT